MTKTLKQSVIIKSFYKELVYYMNSNRIDGLDLGKIGFGCLQLEGLPEEMAENVIVQAYGMGVRLFDTAAAYGNDRHNEKILANAVAKIRNIYGETANVFVSTKCGINFATMGTKTRGYEGSPHQIRESVERSLIELKVSQIPLLYLHRIDPEADDEEVTASFEALRELVEEGKIKYIGLSECTAQQILKADEVFQKTSLPYNPFAFVQSAFSIATQRANDNGVLKACQEKGIQFVSYTSVVRGLVDVRILQAVSLEKLDGMEPSAIIGNIKKALEIPENDFKLFVGFFHESVIKANIGCMLHFQELARKWDINPSQLALAWQMAQGILPIPGTSKLDHLRSNVDSSSIKLSSEKLQQINDCFITFVGNPNIDGMLDDGRLEVKV
jgi:aryl-alcohol dehydrogenase-like predicted oxidoreductase